VTDLEETSLAGIGPRCRRCKRLLVRPMRDPCLVELGDAVVSACCGHARPDLATVVFADGRAALHAEDAIRFFAERGCGPSGDVSERRVNTT
jgi:hypothetical protein